MINVKIDEVTLLNLFMNRLEYWTSDDDVLELYESYLKDLIDCGCFDDSELDVDVIIDNIYINDTTIMDKEMLDDNDIEVDDSDKVLAKNEDKDLYLVSSY
ncbi:MAG: hypothetical protein MSS80_03265 [Mollicutes bacterium]|nr:hypothetical protein [Mollicutes bacterium]